MYDKCITLYNRHGGVWYPTTLENVNVAVTTGGAAGEAERADKVKVGIRCRFAHGEVRVGEKRWLPPDAWRAESAEGALKTSLTFSDGDEFDFFVVWNGADDIMEGVPEGNVRDADYDAAAGGFYGAMKERYGGVFAVTSVSGPYTVIPHFELTGA